jgi:hypothetical protein
MEIDIDKEKEKFRAFASGETSCHARARCVGCLFPCVWALPHLACSAGSGKQAAKDVLGGFGLAGIVEQLAELKLGELLDTPPPGFDEAVAIAKASVAAAQCMHMIEPRMDGWPSE